MFATPPLLPQPDEPPRTHFGLEKAPGACYRISLLYSKSFFLDNNDRKRGDKNRRHPHDGGKIDQRHEKVSPGLWASVFAGLRGVWVIIGPTGMDFSLSMLFPFLAALDSALYQIATRLLHDADSSLTTLFYTALAGVLACGGFLPFAAVAPGLADTGLMVLLGFLGVVSHFCLIRAFAAAPANIVAPFGYTALLWANLFGLLIFGEIPGPRTLIGAGLIAAAGLFVFLRGPKT